MTSCKQSPARPASLGRWPGGRLFTTLRASVLCSALQTFRALRSMFATLHAGIGVKQTHSYARSLLELKDIDWRRETIFFNRSKGGRSQSLRLIPAVGEAILRYIRHARHNESECRRLFLRDGEPYGAIDRHDVYRAARKALEGVGVESAHLGPHCIRHSFATHHVNSGRSLKEVSDMLGHRSLGSTAVYAKVDLASLREVAEMDGEGAL